MVGLGGPAEGREVQMIRGEGRRRRSRSRVSQEEPARRGRSPQAEKIISYKLSNILYLLSSRSGYFLITVDRRLPSS